MEGQRTLVSLCTLASINQVCWPCIITWCAAEGATFGSHFRYVPLWLDAQEVAPDNYFPIFGWFAPSRKQLKVNRTKIFDVVLITNNAGFVIVNSLLISNMWSSGIYLNFVVIKWFNDRNMRRNLPFDYKHYKQDDAESGSGRVLISPTVNNFSSKIFPNNCLVRKDKW